MENVPGADAREGKTLYILNHTECGDASGTYTVREWLGMFGIPAEDEFFKKWQKTAVYLAQKFNEMEKHAGGDEMMAAWMAAYAGLYLNYDTGKAFMPQFEENAHNVRSMLDEMENGKGGRKNV